jgi:hypothetical protein
VIAVAAGVIWSGVACGWICVLIQWRRGGPFPRTHRLAMTTMALLLLGNAIAAVLILRRGEWDGLLNALIAGWCGWVLWELWKRRPRKDKKPARATGRVVVDGWRLRVVPT